MLVTWVVYLWNSILSNTVVVVSLSDCYYGVVVGLWDSCCKTLL